MCERTADKQCLYTNCGCTNWDNQHLCKDTGKWERITSLCKRIANNCEKTTSKCGEQLANIQKQLIFANSDVVEARRG